MWDEAAKDMCYFICISCILRFSFQIHLSRFTLNGNAYKLWADFLQSLFSRSTQIHQANSALETQKDKKEKSTNDSATLHILISTFILECYHHQYFQCSYQVSRFLIWLCWRYRCNVRIYFNVVIAFNM